VPDIKDTSNVPNQRATRQDAIAQLNLARIGALVKENGAPLTVDNLDYLIELRNRVFEFSDAIEAEIDRIETLRAAQDELAAERHDEIEGVR